MYKYAAWSPTTIAVLPRPLAAAAEPTQTGAVRPRVLICLSTAQNTGSASHPLYNLQALTGMMDPTTLPTSQGQSACKFPVKETGGITRATTSRRTRSPYSGIFQGVVEVTE
jgi:hypothetical protein